MLRIAMLSYWHVHAPGYTREVLRQPDTKITVVWDEVEARGAKWAADLGATFVPDLYEAVNRADVDAVIVNAPTNRHEEVIVAAAAAGKHVFTEKVLAPTVAAADRIAAAVQRAGVQFCISLPRLTEPGIRFCKEAVEKGWLGQVTLLRTRIGHTGVTDGWLPDHFLDAEACGGGALIDLGAHPVYTALHLLGRPDRVSARFANVNKAIEVEDNAVAVWEYGNGSLAVIEASFTSRFTPFSVEAHGTEGTLFYSAPDGVRIQSRPLGPEVGGWLTPARLPKALPSAMTQWVEAIRGGAPAAFGLEVARHLSELMEAATISAREGRPVELPLGR